MHLRQVMRCLNRKKMAWWHALHPHDCPPEVTNDLAHGPYFPGTEHETTEGKQYLKIDDAAATNQVPRDTQQLPQARGRIINVSCIDNLGPDVPRTKQNRSTCTTVLLLFAIRSALFLQAHILVPELQAAQSAHTRSLSELQHL
jgi:hypothetical protein